MKWLVLASLIVFYGCRKERSEAQRRLELEEIRMDRLAVEHCAAEAKRIIKQYDREDFKGWAEQENHYSRLRQKCFVKIRSSEQFLDNVTMRTEELMDGYENKVVVRCTSTSPSEKRGCNILPIASASGEWVNLEPADADGYMTSVMRDEPSKLDRLFAGNVLPK